MILHSEIDQREWEIVAQNYESMDEDFGPKILAIAEEWTLNLGDGDLSEPNRSEMLEHCEFLDEVNIEHLSEVLFLVSMYWHRKEEFLDNLTLIEKELVANTFAEKLIAQAEESLLSEDEE